MKLVIVDWVDSAMDFAGWQSVEEAGKLYPPECQTVGWVVKDTEDKIVLAMSHSEVTVGGKFTINKICITNTKILNDVPDIKID